MALLMGSGRVVPVAITSITSNQSKSGITPSTVSQIIRPDSGYTGLSAVTVDAIPNTYYLPSGTYTVTNSGTYDIKSKLSVSTPAMANPTWTAATLNSSAAKVVYSITLSSGFKSTSQIFSSSYTLPTVAGTTIVPNDTSQVAVESYKWTTGSIVVGAIPSTIAIYKKIYEKTINDDEVNSYLSNQTSIGSYMFVGCNNLSSLVYGNNITSIGAFAFSGCSNLQAISFPNLSIVPSKICSTCRNLKSIYLSNATLIGSNAFEDCYSLNTVYAPNVESVYGTAFGWCSGLTELNFPKLTYISGGAFSYCRNLTTASLSLLSLISGGYAFAYCYSLSIVDFPLLTKISGNQVFANCSNLTSVNLPMCSYLGTATFSWCNKLQVLSLPKIETFYGTNTFYSCGRLTSLYLMNSVVATLSNSNAFSSTPIVGWSMYTTELGSIYVPASLVNSYKTATNWSYFSDRFVGI